MHRKKSVRVGVTEMDRALREALIGFLTDRAGWRRPDNFEAFDAFDELLSMGCDGLFLAVMLEIIANAYRADTWEGLTGFPGPGSTRTAVKRLRTCAEDIDRLLGGVIGKALLQSPSECTFPTTLRGIADRFERVVHASKPKTNLTKRAALGAIVRHVSEKTGGPHDDLVARLVSPALGLRDAAAQKQWRSENVGFIAAVRWR